MVFSRADYLGRKWFPCPWPTGVMVLRYFSNRNIIETFKGEISPFVGGCYQKEMRSRGGVGVFLVCRSPDDGRFMTAVAEAVCPVLLFGFPVIKAGIV